MSYLSGKKELDVVACACHPCDGGSLKYENYSPGWLGQKAISYLQK
jgi:hypothetical protein